MKKLLPLTALLALALVGCGKYASEWEANQACKEWEKGGETFSFLVRDWKRGAVTTEGETRACLKEDGIFIGIEMKAKTYEEKVKTLRTPSNDHLYEVKKRFRYD